MKKQYVAPVADVIEFDYREQVVASNPPDTPCTETWTRVRVEGQVCQGEGHFTA